MTESSSRAGEHVVASITARPWPVVLCALLVTGIVCAIAFSAALPSASTDIAFHYRLADVIARYGGQDPSVLEPYVASYPPLAHWMAAIVGRLFGSTLLGVLAVGAFAAGAVYFVIFYFVARTSVVAMGGAVVALLALLSLHADHGAIHGFELVVNYFFGQFVGLALCWVALLALSPFLEEGPTAKTTLLATLFIFVVAAAHLMPALQLAGTVTIVLAWRTLATRQWIRLACFCLIAGTVLLIHPGTATMLFGATHNGSVALPAGMAAATPLVGVVDIVLALILLRIGFRRTGGHVDGATIIAGMGLATGALCVLQFAALKMGVGVEYAVTKYAHGVYTMVVIQGAVLLGMLGRSEPMAPSAAVWLAAGAAITVTAMILPRPLLAAAPVDELARYMRESTVLLGKGADQQTMALARSLDPAASHIATLPFGARAARKDNPLLSGHMPDPAEFRYAVVDVADPLFPRECDVAVPTSRFRVVAIDCALPHVTELRPGRPMLFGAGEQGGFTLRKGWSWVREDGVWNIGRRSTIALRMPPTQGARLVIDTLGYVVPQRPSLRIRFSAAGRSVEQVYDLQASRASTLLPVPDSDVARDVELVIEPALPEDGIGSGFRLFSIALATDKGN